MRQILNVHQNCYLGSAKKAGVILFRVEVQLLTFEIAQRALY